MNFEKYKVNLMTTKQLQQDAKRAMKTPIDEELKEILRALASK